MKERPRLRKLIVVGLVCYTVVLSLVVALHGHLVNERVEQLIWKSMLEGEMTYLQRKVAEDPAFDWTDFDVFHWYDEHHSSFIPAPLLALSEGIHDEIQVDEKQFVVMVESLPEGKRILALDITDIEKKAHRGSVWVQSGVLR